MELDLNTSAKALILQTELDSIDDNGFDTDLSSYYELFKNGEKDKAKAIYRNKLELKYPEEEKRIQLMRSYRTKDPMFPQIYGEAIGRLLARLVDNIIRHIDGVIESFENVGSNPMSVLKAIQRTLRKFFPINRDAAETMIERLESYAAAMNYRSEELTDVTELLLGYLDNSIFRTDTELKVAKEQQETEYAKAEDERKKRAAEKRKKKRFYIDFNKITFSREDLAEIRIDPRLKRKAHKVLAYCRLYWTKINDSDFERKIFLYSKKYNTKHYDIYSTIKSNRLRQTSDDVILLEVFNHLSKGYEYSISEDNYMRQAWKRIKPAPIRIVAADETEGQEEKKKPNPVKRKSKITAPPSAARKKRPPRKSPRKKSKADTPKTETETKPQKPVKKAEEKKPDVKEAARLRVKTDKPADKPAAPKSAPQIKKRPEINRYSPAAQSLKDKVGELKSGLFKNYHRLFKTKLVNFIEEYLIRDAITLSGSKLNKQNLEEAKDIIHKFIMENYDNPDYNWIASDARKKLEKIGFLVAETFTITSRCFNFIKDASVSEEYKKMTRSPQ